LCNQEKRIFQDDNNTPTIQQTKKLTNQQTNKPKNQQTNKPTNQTRVGSKQDLPL
jgi:hypothetical protein